MPTLFSRWPEPLRWVAWLVLAAVAVWLLLVLLVALLQERLLFAPVRLAADADLSNAPDVQERWVEVEGGRLSVLELRHPEPRGVVFFLHGNAGNLQTWSTGLEIYRRTGFDLVMPDYRGFGKSTGRIASEPQLHEDVEAVWQAVAPRYAGLPVVGYGRSLGTALIAQWAARHQPPVTVLVSPYESMLALASLHYPWVPRMLLRYPLRTDLSVPRIEGRVLLIHGSDDALIPASHSQTLADRARQPEVLILPGADHGDLHGHPLYLQRMQDLLMQLARPS